MDLTITLFLVFSVTLVAKGQETPVVGCPRNCSCKPFTNGVAEFQVLCNTFPGEKLPPGTKKLKANKCPDRLTSSLVEKIVDPSNKVSELDLRNSGIQNIDDFTFTLLPELKILLLSSNNIASVPNNAFHGCTKMTELHLEGNGLNTIGGDCFLKLENLKMLNLQNNKLKTIPKLPSGLEKLNASHNSITDVDYKFEAKMKELDLCQNPIKTITPQCFNATANLSELCVPTLPPTTAERLTSLPSIINLKLIASEKNAKFNESDEQQIRNLKKLEELTIVGYAISSPKFLQNVHLKQLSLYGVNVKPGSGKEWLDAFANQTALTHLYLAGSPQLAKMLADDELLWKHLNRLEYIGLQNCELKNLGHIEIYKTGSINVDLSGNPLHCNCSLTDKFKNKFLLVGDFGKTVCFTPEKLKGTPLSTANSNPCIKDDNPIKKIVQTDLKSNGTSKKNLPPPPYLNTEESKKRYSAKDNSKTAYIVMGVLLGLATIGSIIFAVLFFHFRRRGDSGIEEGNANFNSQANSRDNLVEKSKK